jgi:hypothetical protein
LIFLIEVLQSGPWPPPGLPPGHFLAWAAYPCRYLTAALVSGNSMAVTETIGRAPFTTYTSGSPEL